MARSPRSRKAWSKAQEERRTPPTVGKGSSFASKDWWASDWWLLDKQGHSNDVMCDVGTVGDLAVAAASVRGNHHRYDGTRCEDSFCLAAGSTENEDQFLVAVIGDGIGSAEFSAYGSSRARTGSDSCNCSCVYSPEHKAPHHQRSGWPYSSSGSPRGCLYHCYP